LKIAMIGMGGITRSLLETLGRTGEVQHVVTAILSRSGTTEDHGAMVDDIGALLATKPDIVVECAGHDAVTRYGESILAAGVPLMIASIGALADPSLYQRLSDAASLGGSRLILASGAMAGIEALAAARYGGLDRVRYTGRKPPLAWRGTLAEDMIDLAELPGPCAFYSGNARDAALKYPKNSNVAATVALAGLGFDRTEVRLVADPTIATNVHELRFEGADGSFEIAIHGKPSKNNPKTSALTAHSIARLLSGMAAPVVI
jgi:aspartate dehydrogenase